jgi:hypothetical protein
MARISVAESMEKRVVREAVPVAVGFQSLKCPGWILPSMTFGG